MKCRICGEPAEQERFLVWTQMTWVVFAMSSSHEFFGIPCCETCQRKGRSLTTVRILMLAGFVLFVLAVGLGSILYFVPENEGVVGWGTAIGVWLVITFSTYFGLSRIIGAKTSAFLQSDLDARLKRRSDKTKTWSLFNGYTLANKAPGNVRIQSLGDYGAQPSRPKAVDADIAEEDRDLSLDELQKKYGYSKGSSIHEAINQAKQ